MSNNQGYIYRIWESCLRQHIYNNKNYFVCLQTICCLTLQGGNESTLFSCDLIIKKGESLITGYMYLFQN